MIAVVMILFAFFCGSLPFSVWIGKIFSAQDVRQLGDGNPGSTNVFKTGNKLAGLLALVLDISKAAIPVGLAYQNLNLRGFPMLLVAISPALGHAFSPFLGFKGGKSIATVFGGWIGLTLWKVSLPAALAAAVGVLLITPSGWSILFALVVILLILVFWLPDPLLVWVWFFDTLILVWTHRADLRRLPHLRPWLVNILQKGKG